MCRVLEVTEILHDHRELKVEEKKPGYLIAQGRFATSVPMITALDREAVPPCPYYDGTLLLDLPVLIFLHGPPLFHIKLPCCVDLVVLVVLENNIKPP